MGVSSLACILHAWLDSETTPDHNNLMTMTNVSLRVIGVCVKSDPRKVVFKKLYPADYTPVVATRLSNALLVGEYSGPMFSRSSLNPYNRRDYWSNHYRLAL